ncbi:Holliday junction resolvase RecU [Parasporobacterium paucivorans]|uniref:Holliday junction resolvase RecU n=1 Tax=Parasporobacterium paucivorans DSM 15970 TaxID=1122934 RepID=A0A1M6A678_9FIRM|nr:Holliday junction resolvase RecU [Parasporobacterium paucivorans]SHI32012.1 recombination protein U [Parasporobacterium paucivorans DSM 15970]
MPTWGTRGLRGSGLEDLINLVNEKYREKGVALVQKVPTPIKPIRIDSASRHITLAYFEKKSTVDYIGVVQGVPVCFDVKECNTSRFPLSNIHAHQIQFMEDFERQDGIAFLIIYYSEMNMYYYLTFRKLMEFWNRSKDGGLKSFSVEELDMIMELRNCMGVPVHYLEGIQKDLGQRD